MSEQQQQPHQPSPGESGYVPPTDRVPLPSKGAVYPADSPLAGATHVEIRSMTTEDEDILSSRALLKSGRAIDVLLQSCLVNKTIDPDLMLECDRNALLIAIRITGYGAEYSPEVECPRCDARNEPREPFNLAAMEVKPLGVKPLNEGENAFGYVLPLSKKNVAFRLLTGKDNKDLATMLERQRKAQATSGRESNVTARLFAHVIAIDGEKDPAKLSRIIRSLSPRDSRALRQYIAKVEPGVKMEQRFVCPSCGEETEVDMPFTSEFFFPTLRS